MTHMYFSARAEGIRTFRHALRAAYIVRPSRPHRFLLLLCTNTGLSTRIRHQRTCYEQNSMIPYLLILTIFINASSVMVQVSDAHVHWRTAQKFGVQIATTHDPNWINILLFMASNQWLKWGGKGCSAPCSDLSPPAIVWAPLTESIVLFYAQITPN